MKKDWVRHCLALSRREADFYSGARKILRVRTLRFGGYDDEPRLTMEDAGYTSNKMRYLERGYLHEESRATAVQLWERRKAQAKYGSVGFTTYNHFIKNDPTKKSKRASVMGPCIQSVTLTWVDKRTVAVDCFYRTTELFKKFPADLVFLKDVLLKPFDFGDMRIGEVNCHFANITIHPMYFVTVAPHIPKGDFIEELDRIREADKYFFDWVVKWTARYVCPEYMRGIQKFAQAMRVHKFANEAFTGKRMKEFQDYLRANHPGYRNDYEDPDEEDEE
jgi:hypothetical protein